MFVFYCLLVSKPKTKRIKQGDREKVNLVYADSFKSIEEIEETVMNGSFDKMKQSSSICTIRKDLLKSIAVGYQNQGNLIQYKLRELARGWTDRRSYSYDVLSLMIDHLVNIPEPNFDFLDDDNFYRMILLCDEEYKPRKEKNDVETIERPIDDDKKAKEQSKLIGIALLKSIVDQMKASNAPPPLLPSVIDGDQPRVFATLLARPFASEVKKNLYLNYFNFQKKCLNEILKQQLDRAKIKYNSDSFDCLSLNLRKSINRWSFKSTASEILKQTNFDDLIAAFVSIRPQITRESEFGLTKQQLKTLSRSQLFGYVRKLVLLVRSYSNSLFHIRLVPKTSNSIISLPFDHEAFRAVFPKILKANALELFDLFDRSTFNRPNCVCDGYFKSDGVNISMTFHRSDLIRNQIKLSKELAIKPHPQSQKAILKMCIIIIWLMTPDSDDTQKQ